MYKKALMLLLVAGVMAMFASAGSALFTSQATVVNNTFSTGEVKLTTSSTSAFLTLSNMVPGDQVTAPLVVSNSGSPAVPFRYAMTSLSTDPDTKALRDALRLTIRVGGTCTAGSPGVNSGGTPLYDNLVLNGAAFGNPAPGPDSGDRPLAAGANETLCFSVLLPLSATGPQAASTTTTFTFDAEQTANNP